MKITIDKIKIKDLFKGFDDRGEDGVTALEGDLIIRPAYQREFIYNQKQQEEVIKTVKEGLPLNSIYWVKTEDNKYEVLDGQQRILSICSYLNSDFSIDFKFWHNLDDKEKDVINNYELFIYKVDSGSKSEKMRWFERINIAGEKLTLQELRNANYTGTWLTDAKSKFSRSNCAAYLVGKNYLKGSILRQDFLETALKGISSSKGEKIEDYMAAHQQDKDADVLWEYFDSVITWTKETFPKWSKEMKGLPWMLYYNEYQHIHFDDFLDAVDKLMKDIDVTKKKGIYLYLLSDNEKHLSIRAFNDDQIATAFTNQKGVCPACSKTFKRDKMEADHIIAWSKGGKTDDNNLQMLCKPCNREKSDN